MRKFPQIAVWTLAVLAACQSVAIAQTRTRNPYSSETDIAEGRRLYSFYCVFCHGMNGKTGRGARLATTVRRNGDSDTDMYRTISQGVAGTEMQGLWADEETIWKILAFVRTLEPQESDSCQVQGADVSRGQEVFTGKGACASCHTVGMGGGRLGPDLTWIGASSNPEHLKESLIDAGKQISARYRTIEVVANDGVSHEGVLLNEDEHTVHLMTTAEELLSFKRPELSKVDKPARSLMPSYGEVLSPTEISDLVAYLCTLRGPEGRTSE
jgi:putative heme-binding domain-containing protein